MTKQIIAAGIALSLWAGNSSRVANQDLPKSPAAAAAVTRGEKALADAKSTRDKSLSEADAARRSARGVAAKRLADDIDKALKAALDSADLEEANRIDVTRKSVRATGSWDYSEKGRPTSPLAVAAIDRFDEAMAAGAIAYEDAAMKASAAYAESEAEVEARLASDLDAPLKAAMRAGDLEDANRIDALKKAAAATAAQRRSAQEDTKKSVVFVCDASASSLNKLATLKYELSKAIGDHASFDVIFLHDGGCEVLSKTQLVASTPQNLRNASRFLDDVIPGGTGNPVPGLRLALQLHPQIICFMTGGDFLDDKAVRDSIVKLAAGGRIKMYTVGCVNKQDADTSFLGFLQQLAKDSGGVYKRVSSDDDPWTK